MQRSQRRPESGNPHPYHRGSLRAGRRRPLDAVQRTQARFWFAQHRRHGRLTPERARVAEAILSFVNPRDGRCFPSYAAIAARAGVAESTVGEAIKALRALKLLDWDMRILRLSDGTDHQTSNAYEFLIVARVTLPAMPADFLSSLLKPLESVFTPRRHVVETKAPSELEAALASLGRAIKAAEERDND